MDSSFVVSLARETLLVSLMVAAPALLVSLLVGVVIGLLQAATQIHETTLVFVPKMVLVAAVTVVLGHWEWAMLISFSQKLFGGFYNYIR